jgi:hypothetical protein
MWWSVAEVSRNVSGAIEREADSLPGPFGLDFVCRATSYAIDSVP